MAITRTPLATATGDGNNVTITNITCAAGETLLVIGAANSTGIAVAWGSESLSQTSAFTGIWHKVIVTGGTQSIVITWSDVRKFAFVVTKLSGTTSPSLDKFSAVASATSTSPTSNATTTTAQADEILIGSIIVYVDAAQTGTWSNSFNSGQSANSTGGSASDNQSVNEGYLVVSATGAYTAAKTGVQNAFWLASIATFKAAAETVTPRPPVIVNQAVSRASSW